MINTALPELGAHVTSPVAGAMVRWRVKGAFASIPFRLLVLRPAPAGQYTFVAASDPETPVGTAMQTFSTNLPIEAGHTVAVMPPGKEAAYGEQEVAGAQWELLSPTEGSMFIPAAANAGEVGFNADVQPRPELILLKPDSGPVHGGTPVTIAGHDFDESSMVKFGPNISSDVTVNSEFSITAVSPPAAGPGPVDVTVTTAAGTTAKVEDDHFTYVAAATASGTSTPNSPKSPSTSGSCVVPSLVGKTLKASRRKLRRAHCALGRVSGGQGSHVRVARQRPRPGAVLEPGSKVSVGLKR